MTDEELLTRANRFILEHETDESALASVALWNLLKDVRLETARACAEECDSEARLHEAGAFHAQFNPERSDCTNRQVGAERCASAIRAKFGVE